MVNKQHNIYTSFKDQFSFFQNKNQIQKIKFLVVNLHLCFVVNFHYYCTLLVLKINYYNMAINLRKSQKTDIGLSKTTIRLGWNPSEGLFHNFDLDAILFWRNYKTSRIIEI